MLRPFFALLIASALVSLAFAIEASENSCFESASIQPGDESCLGFASLDVMKQSESTLSLRNFSGIDDQSKFRRNAEFCLLHRNYRVSSNYETHKLLDEMIGRLGINKQEFVDYLFVDIHCPSDSGDATNFLVYNMLHAKSSAVFNMIVDYGFDVNRPLVFEGGAGTLLDIFKYLMSTYGSKDPKFGKLGAGIGYLKAKKQAKTCRVQGIKCSINWE